MMHGLRITSLMPAVLAMAIAGCASMAPVGGPTERDLQGEVRCSIAKSLSYLASSQVTDADVRRSKQTILAGEWPQSNALATSFGLFRLRDSNGWSTAAILQALARLSQRDTATLGLDAKQLETARSCRLSAVEALGRFRYRGASPAFGSYGYWPWIDPSERRPTRLLDWLAQAEKRGPRLWGDLKPLARPYPSAFAVWPDADTSATCYLALRLHLDCERRRGTPGTGIRLPRLDVFSRYRDQVKTNRYAPGPEVLPAGSGVFLTWLHPDSFPDCPNEADLVVNAAVLAALGAGGQTNLRGVREATAWINRVIRAGLHRNPRAVTPHYQHAWMIHYFVAKACRDGELPALKPAVELLVAEVINGARRQPDGSVGWTGENDVIATMCALGTLVDGGYRGPLLDDAARFLLKRQRADGSWGIGWIRMGSADIGFEWKAKSNAAFSALTMDVLRRYTLVRAR